MSETSLSIPFVKPGPEDFITNPYWLYIEVVRDDFEDGMTVGEAAAIIDNLYKVDPCGLIADPYNREGNNPVAEEPPPIDDWAAILAKYNIPTCDMLEYADDGDVGGYDTEIKVFRSHPGTEIYKLRLSNGTASFPRRVEERVIHTLDAEDVEYLVLNNPIIGRPVIAWIGVDGPDIEVRGNTLLWKGKFTGSIRAEFNTVYDLISIHVHGEPTDSETIDGTLPPGYNGTGWYSGDEDASELENNQSIECSVLAFYHYQFEELVLTKPDKDPSIAGSLAEALCSGITGDGGPGSGSTIIPGDPSDKDRICYQEIETENICQCSKKTKIDIDVKEVKCPKDVNSYTRLPDKLPSKNYTNCGETDEVNDPIFYEEKCCYPWPFPLKDMPLCQKIYSEYGGNNSFDDEKKQAYIDQYKNIDFIPVGTKSGICGEQVVEQDVEAKNCCEDIEIPVLEFIPGENPTVIADYSSVWIVISGGALPFIWSVEGEEAYFLINGQKVNKVKTESRSILLYTDNTCGTIQISVEDWCDQEDSYELRATTGTWDTTVLRQWDPWDHAPWDPDTSCEAGTGEGDEIDWDAVGDESSGDTYTDYQGYTRVVIKGTYRFKETADYTGYWGVNDPGPSNCTSDVCGSGRQTDPVEAWPPCAGIPSGMALRDCSWALGEPGITDCLLWVDDSPCCFDCGETVMIWQDRYGTVTCGTATWDVMLFITSRRWETWEC